MATAMEFKEFLAEELLRRQRHDSHYSQREFARLLAIDNSRLSKILRGERPVRGALLENLASKLGLQNQEIEEFKNTRPVKRNKYKLLKKDQLQLITEWRHYAILELIILPQFQKHPEWIAKALYTTPMVIQDCLDRLRRTQLLKITRDGRWLDASLGHTTHVLGPDITTPAHRESQKQVLHMAAAALFNTPIEERDQTSMMMATSRKKLATAKQKITKFRRELCDFLERGSEKDEVMQLSISLYPVTHLNRNENGE